MFFKINLKKFSKYKFTPLIFWVYDVLIIVGSKIEATPLVAFSWGWPYLNQENLPWKKLQKNFNAIALFSLIIKIEGQPLQVKINKEERWLYLAI